MVCPGKKACTLFYPKEEREMIPLICGVSKEGKINIAIWSEAPDEFIKVLFR